MKVLIPGSFDPPTFGHLDLISRSAKIFDRVLIGIGENSQKKTFLSVEERKFLLQKMLTSFSNVQIISFKGLTIDLIKTHQIDLIVKGIRNALDFDQENLQASMNYTMANVETLFLPSRLAISSSLVKEIAQTGHSISSFVPKDVEEMIFKKLDFI